MVFDREMLVHCPKALEKWFPVTPVHHMHNYSDIQGDIRIETTLYEKVITRVAEGLIYIQGYPIILFIMLSKVVPT